MHRITNFKSGRHEKLFRLAAIALPLLIAVCLLTPTVFAQNTYVITDGSRVLVHTTAATDPRAVLDEAGLPLGAEDTYTTNVANGVSEINVRRYQHVTINNCGQPMTADAHNETVGQLLDRLGIILDEDTVVSQPLDALTHDGMELEITRTIHTTETYTRTVPYKTVYFSDSSLPAGTEQVIAVGSDGEMRCTADVTYRNGQLSQRTVTKELMTRQPKNALVARGCDSLSGEDTQLPFIGDGFIVTETGEVLTYTDVVPMLASAYTKTDEGCNDYTATGTLARVGEIAVDPSVIPYGTRMFIVSDDGVYIYGIATAEDCGGAINGDRVDLYFDTTAECFEFGMRDVKLYILG